MKILSSKKYCIIIIQIFSLFAFFGCKNESSTNENIFETSISEQINKENFDFYPTSTTNQVINHNYYSLSYSENNEQAEWVAYELKGNTIQNNYSRPYFIADKKVKISLCTS